MKKQKHLFNEALRRYKRYIGKLNRLMVTGRNEHRQGVLRKHIAKLEGLLNSLHLNIKRTAVIGGIATAALFVTPQVNAQVSFQPFDPPFFKLPINVGTNSAPTFVDVDGDGDLDLISGNENGAINYYQNDGSGNYIEPIAAANPFNGIDVGDYSTPTFVDVDGDGDLDLISGNENGAINYYQNDGSGNYIEQIAAANPFNSVDVGYNSTPTFVDVDGDGNLDLVSGQYYGAIKYYQNDGSGNYIEQIAAANPFNAIDVGYNSTPTFVDVDGDGNLDLISGERIGTIKYYQNDGSGNYIEQIAAANPFNGIDVGYYSTPTFVDVDGDGDLDLVSGKIDGTIKYFQNDGSGTYTEQTAVASPFNGLDVANLSTATFGDVDGDGDLDLVSGESYGAIKYFQNDGTGAYFDQTGALNPFDGFDLGFYSAPTLVDVDGDGDIDLVSGGTYGTIKYYQNDGSGNYTEQTGAINPFDGIDVGYNSIPTFVDIDGDSNFDLLIGEFYGTIKYYQNDGSGNYIEQTGAANPFDGLNFGDRFTPTFVDIYSDGNIDLVIGESTGTIKYYQNDGVGNYTEQTGAANPFDGFDVGSSSAPTFVDLDGDGDMDLVSGNFDGNFLAFENTTPIGCSGIVTTWKSIEGGVFAWSNGEPDITTAAIINANYFTEDFGSFEACSLTIYPFRGLGINEGTYVKVQNNIDNAGGLAVLNEGSLVQVNDDATVTNSAFMLVEKTTPTLNNRDFMIVGSPMTAETRDGVHADNIMFRNHVTGNFVPNQDVEAEYPNAENFADDNGDNWVNYTGIINPGEGYLVLPQETPQITTPAAYTFTYQGILNNGVVTYNGLFNTTQNGSPNMVANPYASAIDAEIFMTENADLDVLYFWEHQTGVTNYPGYNPSNYSMGDISLYSMGALGGIGVAAANGGDAPTQFISSGQGFGFKASSAFPVTFNNSMRVTGNNDTYTRPVERELLWLKVTNEQYNLGSSSVIGFSELTTDGFDQGTDVTRLATPVSLYSELPTGEQLAINALSQWSEEATVNMSFSTQLENNETYTISITDIEGAQMQGATVYLIDNQIGTTTNLSEGDYNFTSDAGTFTNRFTVVFKGNSVLGNTDNLLDFVTLYPNPTNGNVMISAKGQLIEYVQVIDISVRVVKQLAIENQQTVTVDLSELASAVYMLKIQTDNGIVTKRIIKE